MFECFLARLSMSSYSEKFVVKGGMLIAAIVGLDTRATMDLDTILRNLTLTEEKIRMAIEEIKSIDLDDDVSFHIISIDPIRKDDIYGGYCVRINAKYDTQSIIAEISDNENLKDLWKKYQRQFVYAKDITYQDTIDALRKLVL